MEERTPIGRGPTEAGDDSPSGYGYLAVYLRMKGIVPPSDGGGL